MGAALHPVLAAVQEGKGGLYLNVHAQPGVKRPQLRGMHGDAVKIAVAEAAQDGKANAAIVRFVAGALGIAPAGVEVAAGHTSRRKRLFLHGKQDVLQKKLQDWLDG